MRGGGRMREQQCESVSRDRKRRRGGFNKLYSEEHGGRRRASYNPWVGPSASLIQMLHLVTGRPGATISGHPRGRLITGGWVRSTLAGAITLTLIVAGWRGVPA